MSSSFLSFDEMCHTSCIKTMVKFDCSTFGQNDSTLFAAKADSLLDKLVSTNKMIEQ